MDSSDGESWKPSGNIKMKRQTSRRGSSIKLKKKETKTEKEFERSHSHEDKMEMLSPKQNGFAEGDEGDTDEEGKKQQGSIKGMWKKALKTLKSDDTKPSKLSKKGSFTKRKDSESEEEPQDTSVRDVDPVYSLLKCAADLPKVHKAQKDGGHLTCKVDGIDNSSKASSPTSSGIGIPHLHPNYGVEGMPNLRRRDSRATSPALIANEQLHHIVDESLGLEFKTFYKLTSPVKKHPGDGPLSSKNSHSGSLDHY